jgi:hypothetical protein
MARGVIMKTIVYRSALAALQGMVFALMLTAVFSVFGSSLLTQLVALALILALIYVLDEEVA